ncbi:hypothetical protein HD593_008380 [Nonomuraea rubra]|uniref:Uncharacterized protein n=1 Tax=Nonomuraea rubra TaxID=46180 RepID=A0A7X0P1L6_9ACTN|nr:hypothetical protein [Nonomuraea rubra]MBB6553585.1 hypothetical protein [Nonomuraea rubra]
MPAQRADDLVDLAGRLPCQLLDGLQRPQRAIRILVVPQPGRSCPDGDHADRMPGRVVQVTGDTGTFLRGGQQPFLLGLAFRPHGPLLKLGDLLAPQPRPLAGEPRHRPRDRRQRQGDPGNVTGGHTRAQVSDAQATDHAVDRQVQGDCRSRLAVNT